MKGNKMDIEQWRLSLSDKERQLHELAEVMLKKELNISNDKDNGSYFPDKCHAFRSWLKAKETKK